MLRDELERGIHKHPLEFAEHQRVWR
jgi:hypothetical protein